jgi:hypothetical protein
MDEAHLTTITQELRLKPNQVAAVAGLLADLYRPLPQGGHR